MTQAQLITAWLSEHGTITPARMSGKFYKGAMFGSEVSRACRTLRKKGILESHPEGKFEVYKLKENRNLVVEREIMNLS